MYKPNQTIHVIHGQNVPKFRLMSKKSFLKCSRLPEETPEKVCIDRWKIISLNNTYISNGLNQ